MPISVTYTDEIYHHGIPGMHWGVRRYQNKDGSLTAAGKKRAGYSEEASNSGSNSSGSNTSSSSKRKRMKDYSDEELKNLTTRLQNEKNYYDAKKNANESKRNYAESQKVLKKPKTNKPVSEMTDAEIKRALDRKKLEEDYAKAFPRQLSKGEKFAGAVKGVVVDFMKQKGKQIAYDFVEKKAKEYLGVSKNDVDDAKKVYEKLKLEADTLNQQKLIKEYKEAINKTDNGDESKKLQKEAQDYENRTKIDRGQKYFKEGKYEESDPEAKSREEIKKTMRGVRAKRSKRSAVKHGESWTEDFFIHRLSLI